MRRGVPPLPGAKTFHVDNVVTTAEVAEVTAFLASEESSGVNGEAISVALGSVR